MPLYRKKPVEIEAIEWTGKYPELRANYYPPWFNNGIGQGQLYPRSDGKLIIDTLEGTIEADIGDIIIQGVHKEVYPCKPDIFKITYEKI
jgi:hypothetical protein